MKLEAADVTAMDDAQKLVILEALVIGVLADGKVSPEEVRAFDHIVGSLPWGMEKDVLQSLIKQTQQRVIALKSPQEVSDMVIGMANRIPSPELRDKIFFTMCAVMASDNTVNQLEKNTLGMFVFAFGITGDRLAAIKATLTGQPATPPASNAN